jgi:hypothetical protein
MSPLLSTPTGSIDALTPIDVITSVFGTDLGFGDAAG